MSAIIYPVLGVLMVGGMGLTFMMCLEGILIFIETEKQRKKEEENKIG